MDEYTFETLWPASVGDLTDEQILGLSDWDFHRLKSALTKRTQQMGHSRRAAVEKVRQITKVRSNRRRLASNLHEQEMQSFEFQHSDLLEYFQPKRKKRWIDIDRRKLTKLITAKNFSLLDNPIETLNTLSELVRFEGLAKSARLNFDDKRVLDISPFIILGLLSQKMAPYIVGGRIKKSAQKVLEAVELRSFLGIENFKNDLGQVDVWPFPLQRRHTQTATSADAGNSITFQKLADRLVDTVNEWLSALPEPRTLSGEAMGQIANIATETLNNAERHSKVGGKGDWVMAGFMARRPVEEEDGNVGDYDEEHWYDCHLAFVNRGLPISDAVTTSPSQTVLDDIGDYQSKHRKGFGKQGISPETLATVFAMQDNVSSKPDNAGGKGMMTIIEVTNALSLLSVPAKAPRITVLSGASCVMFKGDYCGFNRNSTERAGRTQFFNSSQSIEIAPSDDHVFDVDVNFPGTIIAVRFTLDPDTMGALNDDH